MIYRCNNILVEGNTYSDIVNILTKRDYELPSSNNEYKELVLKRLKLIDEVNVNSLTDENFIRGLEKLNILKRVYRIFSLYTLGYGYKSEYTITIDNKDYYVYLINYKKLKELKEETNLEYIKLYRGYFIYR